MSDTLEVSINDAHEHRVITHTDDLGSVLTIDGLTIFNVFKRTKVGDKERDGNPLIYALKRRLHYRIGYRALKTIIERAKLKLPGLLNGLDSDFIIPAPSSSSISKCLARVISQYCPSHPPIRSFYRKATVGEVLGSCPNPQAVPKTVRSQYKAALASLRSGPRNADFELKQIDNKIRRYFTPIVCEMENLDFDGKIVVIVDDLFATGSTLIAMERDIMRRGAGRVSAVCLLSGLKNS